MSLKSYPEFRSLKLLISFAPAIQYVGHASSQKRPLLGYFIKYFIIRIDCIK